MKRFLIALALVGLLGCRRTTRRIRLTASCSSKRRSVASLARVLGREHPEGLSC